VPSIEKYIERVDFKDQHFIGTIAFRSEELSLPDGSKMALGIDDGHWLLIYQKTSHAPFQTFKYNRHEDSLLVDQKIGGKEEFAIFKKYIAYFFGNAKVDDLVTLLPAEAG
jgi:hypothetical protein